MIHTTTTLLNLILDYNIADEKSIPQLKITSFLDTETNNKLVELCIKILTSEFILRKCSSEFLLTISKMNVEKSNSNSGKIAKKIKAYVAKTNLTQVKDYKQPKPNSHAHKNQLPTSSSQTDCPLTTIQQNSQQQVQKQKATQPRITSIQKQLVRELQHLLSTNIEEPELTKPIKDSNGKKLKKSQLVDLNDYQINYELNNSNLKGKHLIFSNLRTILDLSVHPLYVGYNLKFKEEEKLVKFLVTNKSACHHLALYCKLKNRKEIDIKTKVYQHLYNKKFVKKNRSDSRLNRFNLRYLKKFNTKDLAEVGKNFNYKNEADFVKYLQNRKSPDMLDLYNKQKFTNHPYLRAKKNR